MSSTIKNELNGTKAAKQSNIIKNGLSQKKIAKLVGISRPSISTILSGQRIPDLDVAGRVAKHTGNSLDDLHSALKKLWPKNHAKTKLTKTKKKLDK